MKIHILKFNQNTKYKFNSYIQRNGATHKMQDLRLEKSAIVFGPNGVGKSTLFKSMMKSEKFDKLRDPMGHSMNSGKIYCGKGENFFEWIDSFYIPSKNIKKSIKSALEHHRQMSQVKQSYLEREVDNTNLFRGMYESNLTKEIFKSFFKFDKTPKNLTDCFNMLRNTSNLESMRKEFLGSVDLSKTLDYFTKLYNKEYDYIQSCNVSEIEDYLQGLLLNNFQNIIRKNGGKPFQKTFMIEILNGYKYTFNRMIRDDFIRWREETTIVTRDSYLEYIKGVYEAHSFAIEGLLYHFATKPQTKLRKFKFKKIDMPKVNNRVKQTLSDFFDLTTNINDDFLTDFSLSYGQKKICEVVSLVELYMASSANICVIDDPSVGLSENNKYLLGSYLLDKSKQKKIIILTHDISFLKQIKSMDKSNKVFDVISLYTFAGSKVIEVVTQYAPFLFNYDHKAINGIWDKMKNKDSVNPVIKAMMPAFYRNQYEYSMVFADSKDLRKLYETVSQFINNKDKPSITLKKLNLKQSNTSESISLLIGTSFDNLFSSIMHLSSMEIGDYGVYEPLMQSLFLAQHFFKLAVIALFRGLPKEALRFPQLKEALPEDGIDNLSTDDLMDVLKKANPDIYNEVFKVRQKYRKRINNIMHYSGFLGDILHDYNFSIFTDILQEVNLVRRHMFQKAGIKI